MGSTWRPVGLARLLAYHVNGPALRQARRTATPSGPVRLLACHADGPDHHQTLRASTSSVPARLSFLALLACCLTVPVSGRPFSWWPWGQGAADNDGTATTTTTGRPSQRSEARLTCMTRGIALKSCLIDLYWQTTTIGKEWLTRLAWFVLVICVRIFFANNIWLYF
jgi:hypothetical protein